MKKLFLIAATVFSIGNVYAQTVQSLEIGKEVPMSDAKMKSVDKKEVTLGSARTQYGLLVMFSCNTCPYVIKSQARTKEVMDYARGKGIGMVIINSNEGQRQGADSYDAMTRYAKKEGYNVPYVLDEGSKVADAFGASRTPEVFLFDGEGKLIYKGAMEDNPSEPTASTQMFLKSAIDNMLSKKPIDPNNTKSVGCSIKRS
ncbi:MAG: thioredoxin family protein [Sphingobacteriales bacterium]|nr:MAG: thioredoxin family protein [Sphingobacteriales bacterium]